MKPIPLGQRYRSVLNRSCGVPVLVLLGGSLAAQGAPHASFTTSPSPAVGEERLLVQFNDLSSGTITSWSWDFGDGATSSEQNPSHNYLFGEFDVSLTVSGPLGADTSTQEDLVEVLFAPPPSALGTMRVPMPDDLASFVTDMPKAVELGKALFWDVQLGSDGLQACATCHFQAGVDGRSRNTLHPGANGTFEPTISGAGGGPNTTLNSGDFPFHKFLDPMDGLELAADTDDRRGAAGMFKTQFLAVDGTHAMDRGTDLDDPLFQVGGTDTLEVTGRDAPTTIGAIFFHRIFWDGRANHFFNGRNIWGNADPSHPTVLEKLPDGSLGSTAILLNNAAAASQAVGPPLSDVEMSWAGRSFSDLGRKMVPRRPLANQMVDPTDGVLGHLALLPGPGLVPSLTYADMIRAAFSERWWGSTQPTAEGYSQMEANFSLFFGLAIQCYEATLIPDQAPYDRFRSGDSAALTQREQHGMMLFLGKGRCIECHDTPVFAGALRDEVIHNNPEESEGLIERMFIQNALTSATLTFATQPAQGELPLDFNPYRRPAALFTPDRQLVAWTRLPEGQRCAPAGVTSFALAPTTLVQAGAGFLATLRLESDGNCGLRATFSVEWNDQGPAGGNYQFSIGGRNFALAIAPPSHQAAYDNGFYNIGVRPFTEDPGVGGNGPFGPLSITRRVQRGEDVGQNTHGGPVAPNERVAVTGSFKTPTLRNVELTGPYMHNGGMATLEQVVEFYTRATDFGDVNFRDKDIDASGIQDMTEQDKADLVAFLKTLTDPRVRFERAPFDHPQLPLKVGHRGDNQSVASNALGNGLTTIEYRPATGADGGAAIPAFVDRLDASISVFVASESRDGARIALICDKPPTSSVTVRLRPSDASVATITPLQVTFTPETWRVTQNVTLQTLHPDTASGTPFTVITSRASSTDPEFSNLPVADVTLDFVAPAQVQDAGTPPRTPFSMPGAAPAPLR